MKISFILPALCGAGGIDVVYEHANRLTKNNEVTIYAPIITYNLMRGNILIDLLKQIYATLKTIKWFYVDKLPCIMSDRKKVTIKPVLLINNRHLKDADCVIATAWCTAYDVSRLSESKGEKVYFVQGYEIWDNEKLGKKSYALPLHKIVIAKWIKDKLISECGCKEEIPVINNGIDTNIYKPKERTEKDKFINCIMLDHDLEKKGVKFGLEAFNKAKEKVPELKLTMFGRKKSSYVTNEIKYYKNPKKNILIDLYQSSDIFIFPSIEEGWGLTPIEAMACKCAVVGTNVGCMLDIGVNEKNVLLCNPKDTDKMAEGIIRLAKDAELRKSIANCGYETVQKLDWETSTLKFESELKKIISK